MEEKCKLCKFWKFYLTQEFSDKPDIDIGHCRRYPKAFKVQTEARCLGLGMTPRSCVVSVLDYPEHKEDDWCGEFNPLDVKLQQGIYPMTEEDCTPAKLGAGIVLSEKDILEAEAESEKDIRVLIDRACPIKGHSYIRGRQVPEGSDQLRTVLHFDCKNIKGRDITLKIPIPTHYLYTDEPDFNDNLEIMIRKICRCWNADPSISSDCYQDAIDCAKKWAAKGAED